MSNDTSSGGLLPEARIMAFVPITDRAKARAFYADSLGLRFVADDGFALVFEHRGTTLRAAVVKSVQPAPYTILGWEVDDISAAAASLEKAGVPLERFPGMPQDEHGIWSAPGSKARVAWFKDPDGNILSISQH